MINNQEPVPTPPIPPITTFTIAGTITEDGTVKVGVPISFTSNSVYTTNGDGIYVATVARNYVGSGTPVFSGGTFTPTSRVYATVISNYTDQNFVYNGTGGFGPQPLPDFVYVEGHGYSGYDLSPIYELPISINGTDAVQTDEDGYYLMQLPYGFTGTIYADDLFGTFSPANYVFYGLTTNQTGKDFLFYIPVPPTPPVTIYHVSGTVTNADDGNALMPNILMAVELSGNYNGALTNSVGVFHHYQEAWVDSFVYTNNPISGGTFAPSNYYSGTFGGDLTNLNFVFAGTGGFGPQPSPSLDCPVPGPNIAPLTLSPDIVSASSNAADSTQGLIWTIDNSGPKVVYYDVAYGTIAGFVDTSPGGATGVAGIIYDPVNNKVVVQDYNYNIQVINAATKAIESVLLGPQSANFHMLCLGSSGTAYATSNRWVVPSPGAEIDVIDLNQTPAVIVARHDQTVSTDSICWATNISRLVVNSGGVGSPRFYLFNPVDGSFQVSVDVNPQNFNYENAYLSITGHLLQGFNSGAAVQVMDIASGTDAVVIHTLTGNGPPTRASDVTEDTCHNRLFVSDGNSAIWEYTLDGTYTLLNQYDDAGVGISPTGLAHSRKTNLVYYNNYNDETIRSVQATTSGTLTWSFGNTDPAVRYDMAFNSGNFDTVFAGDENGVWGEPGGFFQNSAGFVFNGVLINLAPAYSSEVRVDYTSMIDDQGDVSWVASSTSLQVVINGVYTYIPATSQGTVSGSLTPTGTMNYGYNYIQISGFARTGGNVVANPATVYANLSGAVQLTAL